MKYILDVQGFMASASDFIVKELAFIPVEENVEPTVFLFKPPYSWEFSSKKGSNAWLEQNFHGLNWNSGNIPYEELEKILQSIFHDTSDIYVKGLEKIRWLKKLLPKSSICNLEDLGCPSLKKISMEVVICTNHASHLNAVCAKNNVKTLQIWLMNQRREKLEEYLRLLVI